jgi:hypothetical protein
MDRQATLIAGTKLAHARPGRRAVMRRIATLPWVLPGLAAAVTLRKRAHLPALRSVECAANCRVTVTKAQVAAIDIQAEPRVLAAITWSVDQGCLRIDASSFATSQPVEVRITTPDLDTVVAAGVCVMRLEGFGVDRLKVQASGAAHIDGDALNLNRVEADLRDASTVHLAGFAKEQQVRAFDAAMYLAIDLSTQDSTVEMNGVAHAQVWARHSLSVGVLGAATVRHRGQAEPQRHGGGYGTIEREA